LNTDINESFFCSKRGHIGKPISSFLTFETPNFTLVAASFKLLLVHAIEPLWLGRGKMGERNESLREEQTNQMLGEAKPPVEFVRRIAIVPTPEFEHCL
jgi:hypothetical protein